ncbi:MAG: hypothetical protein DRH33_04690 [Candidatus Nealsonbacteria bacterium]|nr:MAG: hypothetical protein DRH33_04690 [Candidatus Nealsonbacteria bacterium]
MMSAIQDSNKRITRLKATKAIASFNYSSVELKESMFKNQFEQMKQYYLAIPNDDILKGFRERAGLSAPGQNLGGWYTGDVSWLSTSTIFNTFGQWLGALARIYKVTNDTAVLNKLDYLLNEWGRTIGEDGYFFYGTNPNAFHYEFDKVAGGLVDIYEYTGKKDSIDYLARITEWAKTNLNKRRIPATLDYFTGGGYSGGEDADTEWYTLSENLYRAYLLSGDSMYKDFARIWHYESYWRDLSEKKHCMTGYHAYSHVNTLSSAAIAYAVTGDTSYLNAIVNAYELLQKTQVFATGGYGPGERMANQYGSLGNSLYLQGNTFETPCGSWAAFKLARYLITFTGKAHYGDWIEKLIYNGIGAALPMGERGKTFYYSDYRITGGEKKYYKDTWPCCSGTYPLAVVDYHNIIYFKDEESLYVNLFVPSQVKWNKAEKSVTLIQNTDFPKTGRVSLKIKTSKPVTFCLKFRVPGWVKDSVSVKVNKKSFRGNWKSGEWGRVERKWDDGDILEIELPLPLYFLPVDNYHLNLAALVYGPVVLVADKSGVLRGDPEEVSSWIFPIFDQGFVFQTKEQINKRKFKPYFTYGEGERYYMYHEIVK